MQEKLEKTIFVQQKMPKYDMYIILISMHFLFIRNALEFVMDARMKKMFDTDLA